MMIELEDHGGITYCCFGNCRIRMDRLVITLTDFTYLARKGGRELELPFSEVRSYCAANALANAGYLTKTATGYRVKDRKAYDAFRAELFEAANKKD